MYYRMAYSLSRKMSCHFIKPYVKWVRTFSCTDGNEHIPRIAREYGIKTLVGAWLGTDEKINAQEIKNLIKII